MSLFLNAVVLHLFTRSENSHLLVEAVFYWCQHQQPYHTNTHTLNSFTVKYWN